MSGATVEAIAYNIISQLREETNTFINWHACEPTTVPIEWYKHATSLFAQSKRGAPLQFSIQTNGISLSDEWVDFLYESRTQVGLSLDGPECIHDLHRRTKNGRGTWKLVMATLAKLRRRGIEPNVISVVTKDTLDRAEDLLDFYSEYNIMNVGLNFEEEEGANAASSLAGREALSRVEEFLKAFLKGIVDRRMPLHVREVERILSVMAHHDAMRFNDQVVPLAIMTIDVHGGIYSFSPEFTEHAYGNWADLCLGSVHAHRLQDIASSAAFRKIFDQIEKGVALCRESCAIWRVCGGGAPSNKLAETGSLAVAETQFCRLNVKAVVKALHHLLPELSGSQIETGAEFD